MTKRRPLPLQQFLILTHTSHSLHIIRYFPFLPSKYPSISICTVSQTISSRKKDCTSKFNPKLSSSARRRTRSGRPRFCADRSEAENLEPSSPGLGSKIKRGYPSFRISFLYYQARDGTRTRDPLLGKEMLHH